MRLGLTLAAVLLLSLVGGAVASDSMIPLLQKQVAGSSAPAGGPAQASSAYAPPGNQGIAMGIAAVAALAVVAIGLLAWRRTA